MGSMSLKVLKTIWKAGNDEEGMDIDDLRDFPNLGAAGDCEL